MFAVFTYGQECTQSFHPPPHTHTHSLHNPSFSPPALEVVLPSSDPLPHFASRIEPGGSLVSLTDFFFFAELFGRDRGTSQLPTRWSGALCWPKPLRTDTTAAQERCCNICQCVGANIQLKAAEKWRSDEECACFIFSTDRHKCGRSTH